MDSKANVLANLPLRSAAESQFGVIVAGGMLAFAQMFDEIIVTTLRYNVSLWLSFSISFKTA